MIIFIPRSKTDVGNIGAEVVISKNSAPYCPVENLARFLQLTRNSSGAGKFILRKMYRERLSEKDVPLSYSDARADLKFYLGKAGHTASDFGWHSLRHGGASEAANLGVPDRLLKQHGRWKSENSKDGYVHEDLHSKLLVSRLL